MIGFLILGLPGETEKTLGKTKKFIRENYFYSRSFFAFPYTNTEIYKKYYNEYRHNYETDEDFEEAILLKISHLTYTSNDLPVELPGSLISIELLVEAMNWIEMENIERYHQLLQPSFNNEKSNVTHSLL